MPNRIPSPCAEPGCPALTNGGCCRKHQRDRHCAQAAYQTLAWRTLRVKVLMRDPICKMCGRAPSTEADHILPRRRGGQDTMGNLQGVCKPCHSSLTVRFEGGLGNRKRERRIAR